MDETESEGRNRERGTKKTAPPCDSNHQDRNECSADQGPSEGILARRRDPKQSSGGDSDGTRLGDTTDEHDGSSEFVAHQEDEGTIEND